MSRCLVALLSLVVVLTMAAGAGAASGSSQLIRHGVGIGKVRLGMTEAKVRAALGRPSAVIQTRAGFGGGRRELQFGGAAYTVVFERRAGVFRAFAASTSLSRERTAEGLGVGSLETRVRRAYGSRLRCEPLRTRPLDSIGSSAHELVSNQRNCVLVAARGSVTVFRSVVKGRFPWTRLTPADFVRARVYIVTVRLASS